MTSLPRPRVDADIILRALRWVDQGEYGLGAGGYFAEHPDDPFTVVDGVRRCDCWRYAFCYVYQVPGHRPGYNRGPHATVSDDVNCDAAIEQAEHPELADRLFEVVEFPRIGDLVVFPSIRDDHGHRIRIGHVGIVIGVPAEWDPKTPAFGELDVVQCQAARRPAVIRGSGMAWLHRDVFRGKVDPAWRSRILRVVP